MIGQQCRMLISNSKFTIGCFLAIMFTILLLFYQEQNDTLNGVGREKCLTWAVEQEQPVEALLQWSSEIYALDFSLEQLKFTDNQYEEMILCYDVADYLEGIENYEELLEQIISQRENINHFSDVTAGELAISQLEAQYYRECAGSPVKVGNYMAFEKFFSFGAVDICLWGIIFLICYFMIVWEREKGTSQLIYASAGGGIRYFFSKLCAVELMTLIMFVLLFGGKLLLFGALYGYGDTSAAVQSMQGYFGAPYSFSIAQYFVIFVFWKGIGAAFLAMLVLVLCSFPLTEALSGVVVFVVLGGSVLLKNIISADSGLVLIRDCTLLQLLSPEYWVTGLRSYCLGNGTFWSFLIFGIGIPVFCVCLFSLILCMAGMQLYYRGLRKSTAAHKSVSKAAFVFGANRWWNEGYYLAIHKKILLAAIGICILYGGAVCSYEEVYNETVKFEREIVDILNRQSFEEAQVWLDEEQAELDAMKERLSSLQEQLVNGSISEELYLNYSNSISTQLRIEPVVEEMVAQEEEMQKYMEETGITPQFEYTALSEQLYADKGWKQRNWTAVMTACFVVFCAMTVFPDARSKELHRILGSTASGIKAMHYRILWLMGMTFFLSAVMQLLWLYSLGKQFMWVGWNSPVQSWAVYRNLRLELSVGQAVLLELFGQCLKWAVIAGAGVWLSMYFANTAWAELAGMILFVMPLVLHILGITWFRNVLHVRSMIYGEWNVLSGAQGVLWILVLGLILLAGLKKETKKWMEA